MKIALVSPIEESVPPEKYGGTEWIVYHLAQGLGKSGNTVDLYAPGNSRKEDAYRLIPTCEHSIRSIEPYVHNQRLRETRKFTSVADTVKQLSSNQYNVIHNHAGWRFLLFSNGLKTPIVTTHHGPLNMDYQNEVFLKYKDFPYVSISNNQRNDLPELNFVATVYNGLDIDKFPFLENPANPHELPMIFLARMSHEKGAIDAAKAAKATGKTITIAAKVDAVDKDYYGEFAPLIDNVYVKFQGEINHETRIKYLQNARCLIAPIQWEEPFGLMFIEAMACGSPVVAFARGAAPEIIRDGETGFLVNSSYEMIRGNWTIKEAGFEGLCKAIEKVYTLSDVEYLQMRKAARQRVEKYFTTETMIRGYEDVYKKLVV